MRKKTYQANEEKEDKESPSKHSLAINVAITHSGHGDNKKIHTCPV